MSRIDDHHALVGRCRPDVGRQACLHGGVPDLENTLLRQEGVALAQSYGKKIQDELEGHVPRSTLRERHVD